MQNKLDFYLTHLFCIFVIQAQNTFYSVQMSFAERLTELRKKKGLSQEELANKLGTKGPAIGRYERGAAKPTIEVASKIARILEVSLDYLVGNTDRELDDEIINRVLEIQNLPEEDKGHILYTLDNLLQNVRTKKAFSTE